MFADAVRPESYRRFERPVPAWFQDAKLGIFVHWGPYSVPAWAEPIGALGTFDDRTWFAHNPYAEWYANTIRIDGSPAQQHQAEEYGGAPYDDFLDAWRAEAFDEGAFMDLVASTGARYFVPTTKHHDGVTLWDAPGTGDRNTVRRGPRSDLVERFARAARERGIRFGAYYSGGLDWWFSGTPPIVAGIDDTVRPSDPAYAAYAHAHVVDLIERYRPDVLWGDIDWPDAGKAAGPSSLIDVFDRYYAAVPDGVVNDRWGGTHWDYRTSEYEAGTDAEREDGAWEHCRGIGYSFGYNRLEGEAESMDGPAAIRLLLDVVSRGGNLLLDVGLTAEGTVPDVQRRTLEALAAFDGEHGEAVFASRPVPFARAADEPWARWTRRDGVAHAFVVPTGEPVVLDVDAAAVRLDAATATGGATLRQEDGRLLVTAPPAALPIRVSIPEA